MLTTSSKFVLLGYTLCIGRPSRLRDWWASIWYRYYCPRPIIDDPTAKACVRSGCCGCDNQGRYADMAKDQA